ncbi:MAG TPA: flagellar assembly protein FliX [Candidatus Accumulibacter sp.]|nr:flagellar assembly protein FliX [Accumulibacter sp.]
MVSMVFYGVMKVEGPGRTNTTKPTGKTRKTGEGGFGTLIEEGPETSESQGAGFTQSVNSIDALLTLQGAEDAASEEAGKRARKRGQDLLDQLDRVRIGLLTGDLSRATLQSLTETAARHRDRVMDPKLAEILDEIDLRAQVELAKFGRS